jgi:hypothetical protein
VAQPVRTLLSSATHPGEPACRICALLPHRRCVAVVPSAGAQRRATAVAVLHPVGEQTIRAAIDRQPDRRDRTLAA